MLNKCPICGEKAMKKGKIQVWDKVYWTPQNEERHGLGIYKSSKNSILIADYNFFDIVNGAVLEADYCFACKKIIINARKSN